MGNGVFEIIKLSVLVKDVLDIIYPAADKCLLCKAELKKNRGLQICGYCRSMLIPLREDVCEVCGRPVRGSSMMCAECSSGNVYFDGAASVFEFRGLIQEAIYRLKYDGEVDIAPLLGNFMAEKLIEKNWDVDLIIPVPLHPDRLSERGFNQSYLLSEEIGRECGIGVSDRILKRVVYTKSQVSLSRPERMLNVKNAFHVEHGDDAKGRSILIVDDIMTTGATLNECSRAISIFNPKNIYCLTAACPVYAK